jgi:hypothetical protein
VTNIDEFDSFDAALEFACENARYTESLLRGPDGVAMDEEELARRCVAQAKVIWA